MRAAVIGLLSAGLLSVAIPAKAGVQIDLDFHSGPPARPVDCPPERVWVPAVTKCVTQNVWHPAVTEERTVRVLVPDRYETREFPGRDWRGRRVTVRQQVLVEPAHYEDRCQTVEVKPGYWAPETTEVVIRPGYWAEAPRRFDDRDRPRFDDRRFDDRRRDDRDYDRGDWRRDRR